MKITVLTIFPEFFDSPLAVSIVKRALDLGELIVEIKDLRAYGHGVHRQVDDAPFGGGAGMVMMIDPIARALEETAAGTRVLLTPAGRPLDQGMFERWAGSEHLVLICGRYEGVDHRVAENLVDEEISLGDFVLAGGEVAAATIVEGIARLLPGVLGNPDSAMNESFSAGLLEEPQYTRPAEYAGWKVPEVLLSGDHAKIAEWRAQQRLERTRKRRPDLLEDS